MSAEPHRSFLYQIRYTLVDFLSVWLLICFVRLFVVENYRVPSGSMTPTLVGGKIAQLDINGDGEDDYVLESGTRWETFKSSPGGYEMEMSWEPPEGFAEQVRERLKGRYDNILVAKFRYWFAAPSRGDIAVFKPPRKIFNRRTPVYVKRIVGLPKEQIGIGTDGRLYADGAPVVEPEHFRRQYYEFGQSGGQHVLFDRMGEDGFLFFGDNTKNSSDGREWGPTPRNNIRGRVFFRYWPLGHLSFI